MPLKLSRLKTHRVFIENLRWDVTLELLFKPRFVRDSKDADLTKETQGFMFYIDYMDDHIALMLMKTYHMRSKTLDEIEDVPKELLLNAVEKPGVKPVVGMYPIDEHLEAWLKAELGLAALSP